MIQVVWEMVVREDAQGPFELAYGPGGAWSKLFGSFPGYRGTTLLRDAKTPRRYLTIDYWDAAEDRSRFMAVRGAEYAKLDVDFLRWTESETELGEFQTLSQATIRPRPRVRRSGARR